MSWVVFLILMQNYLVFIHNHCLPHSLLGLFLLINVLLLLVVGVENLGPDVISKMVVLVHISFKYIRLISINQQVIDNAKHVNKGQIHARACQVGSGREQSLNRYHSQKV